MRGKQFYQNEFIQVIMLRRIDMYKNIKKFLILAMLWAVATSCYRMPGDDDFSVCPTTNNRSLTQETQSMVPEVPY
jgi:hypothetical protein